LVDGRKAVIATFIDVDDIVTEWPQVGSAPFFALS
jgi:hypothetical protein